nr:MAG TPA: hypothetical protein [Bacteriophage sp.]
MINSQKIVWGGGGEKVVIMGKVVRWWKSPSPWMVGTLLYNIIRCS